MYKKIAKASDGCLCIRFVSAVLLTHGENIRTWFALCLPVLLHAVCGSAVMCLNMPMLESKVRQREIFADQLEKVRSHQLATGKVVAHR